MFGERVGLYMWRRDTTVRLRVKILASADRAKAQTAATHRDNSAQGGHLNALSRCQRFFFVPEFRFLSLGEDCFLHSCLRRDTRASVSCLFWGNGVRLHCRDSNGRGAAELAHWTGSIVPLVAKDRLQQPFYRATKSILPSAHRFPSRD